HVLGLGPMPGSLHVSEIASHGHSGRNHVFIIVLDDGRFPGRARQDPVLLDKERKRLSPELPLSIHRPKRREQALHRLCARLGADATLTLSHACRNGDAAVSASSAYRALLEQAGRTGLDNSVLHATLSPGAAAKGITRRDAWLAGLQRHAANAFTAVALRQWFPDLAAGAVAMAARASADFTEYDGYVPEAGADLFAPGRSWSESPSKLEKMAANPLDYFFLKVLRIEPAERYEITPGAWLPANEKGNLAHDLFREFFARLAESGGETTPERHAENRAFLQQLLRQKLAHYRSRALPRDELAYAREADELLQACEIFLAEELVCRSRGRPLYFEVALGLESDAPTPWDRDEPVWLLLPSGRVLGLRGRIDRIDRLHDGSGLIIVDYKTGSSAKHQPADPFRQGRQLQPLLYTHMLSHALEEAGRPEPVRSFRYFFPMPREEGLSVEYSRDKLAGENLTLADLLLDMLSAGCFPFTIDAKDCAYSDYAPIYQACGDCVAGAKRKAESHLLASWRELRKKK
ncbi:MAG: PD-(D/E)XK nuclease family protein, partial [Planctomycetes bacterium]|nr:PD-(D/E)XK nuclease family protein [Planctomycetota bacterium]